MKSGWQGATPKARGGPGAALHNVEKRWEWERDNLLHRVSLFGGGPQGWQGQTRCREVAERVPTLPSLRLKTRRELHQTPGRVGGTPADPREAHGLTAGAAGGRWGRRR